MAEFGEIGFSGFHFDEVDALALHELAKFLALGEGFFIEGLADGFAAGIDGDDFAGLGVFDPNDADVRQGEFAWVIYGDGDEVMSARSGGDLGFEGFELFGIVVAQAEVGSEKHEGLSGMHPVGKVEGF